MSLDREKSRTQLLTEIRQLRKERDRLARGATPRARPEANALSRARLEISHQVSAALVSAATLHEAAPVMLFDLADLGGWDAGMLWLARPPEDTTHLAGAWFGPNVDGQALESLSRQATFLPGRCPLGSVWGRSEQPGLYDLRLDSRSPRALYAVEVGLQWACYFPIWHQQQLWGFFEFFGSEPSPLDSEQSKVLAAAGHQVIQRLLRERAEQQCAVLDSLAGPQIAFAVYELDLGGRVVRWTRDAARLKGFGADEVIGKHVSLFYPSADERRADRNLATAAARGFLKEGGWRIRKGAERYWADVIIMPRRAPHGELVGFTKIVHGLVALDVLAPGS